MEMEDKQLKQRLHFREGLFNEKNSKESRLLANKCQSCGQIFFPKVYLCLNCHSEYLENITLSRHGKLYSFTVVHMPTLHFDPPHIVGLIELPEGIRVFSPIKIEGLQKQLYIGMDVELIIDKLWEEENKEIIGYKFRPLQ